jgi:shikimate dehydrogenase
MRLGLIGKNISHSGSPAIYKKLIGPHIQYDLIDVAHIQDLPSLETLKQNYDGINITSPYKTHYVNQVHISDPAVRELGAINTLAFTAQGVEATNTDLIAVRSILASFQQKYPDLNLIVLGSGVMAQLTLILAQELKLSVQQLSRLQNGNLEHVDLRKFEVAASQNLVINACSRDFIFSGQQSSANIFWDYNYHFLPHQNTLPLQIKEYQDGQEMLYLQAVAAHQFWIHNNH